MEIALKDARLSESDTTYSNVTLDIDDGIAEYEVEFRKDTIEYDYNIDAYTGKILEKDIENEAND